MRGRWQGERGISVIEAIVIAAVLGLLFTVAVTMLRVTFGGVRQSGGTTDDVVHSVASDARAAIAYDPAAASNFVPATWTVDSKTLATGCAASLPSCVQVTTAVNSSVLTISGKNLTTQETSSLVVFLHQEATDPTAPIH